MQLKDTRDAFYGASDSASNIMRTLGLAAIGVIWVVREESEEKLQAASLAHKLRLADEGVTAAVTEGLGSKEPESQAMACEVAARARLRVEPVLAGLLHLVRLGSGPSRDAAWRAVDQLYPVRGN